MAPGKAPDPFAAKRAAMRDEFLGRLFLLGGWLGGTDTYKRTMWAAVPDVALARAGYSLVMRKGLPEPGADNRLIMAGHEAMLAQWFHRPLARRDIELAAGWFQDHSATRASRANRSSAPRSPQTSGSRKRSRHSRSGSARRASRRSRASNPSSFRTKAANAQSLDCASSSSRAAWLSARRRSGDGSGLARANSTMRSEPSCRWR